MESILIQLCWRQDIESMMNFISTSLGRTKRNSMCLVTCSVLNTDAMCGFQSHGMSLKDINFLYKHRRLIDMRIVLIIPLLMVSWVFVRFPCFKFNYPHLTFSCSHTPDANHMYVALTENNCLASPVENDTLSRCRGK